MAFTCVGNSGTVIEPACQGLIDCAHLQSTVRLETLAGAAVTELSTTAPTCVFLEHWDCDDVYVALDGTEDIVSGPGTIAYDSIANNVTKWIYTPDGTGNTNIVFRLAPANSAAGVCDLSLPVEAVFTGACQGLIDCDHLQSTMRLETPAGNVVTELAATGQTCVFLQHWDCDDVYVPLDATESLIAGPGTIVYDSFASNVTKWIYTGDGTTDTNVVFSLSPAASTSGRCDLTIPVGEVVTQNNIHFNAGIVRQKSSLTPSGQVTNATNPEDVVIIENRDFTGVPSPQISLSGKQRVVIRNNYVPGTWDGVSTPAQQVNSLSGIVARSCGMAEIYGNHVHNQEQYGIWTQLNNDDQVYENNIHDTFRNPLQVQANRSTTGSSFIRNNFIWYSENIEGSPRAADMLNVYDPLLGNGTLVVEDNFVMGFKQGFVANGAGIIVDGEYTQGFADAGIRFGDVFIRDNVTLDTIVAGVNVTFGERVTVEGHCDFSDIEFPTPAGTTPSSGGLGIGVVEILKTGELSYPQFGGHVIRNNTVYHIHSSGNEQRFFGTPASAYTLSGNNFTGNGQPAPADPPPFTREEIIAKGLAKVTNVSCFV